MDEKQLKEFFTAIGTLAEMSLLFYRCWEHWSNIVDASPLRGGHPGGQIEQVYGIVEFKDGVRRIDPSQIIFCDEQNAMLCEMAKHDEEMSKTP